jgi:glyoxylase-like metal-dependent hydrolase (beta-lactamase superfamily II)
MIRLSRRNLLAAGASTAVPAFFGLPVVPAQARAPIVKKQAPYFYRFELGGFEGTIVSDGPLTLSLDLFTNVPKDELQKMLTEHFLPQDNVALEQNVLVLNTGTRLILFDTGLGSVKLFGPNSGRLLGNLREAGFDPKDVDALVLSHAHPDHVWGIMSDDGKPNFPNAQLYINQTDFDFWTDLSNPLASDQTWKPLIEGTRKHLLPNRERIIFVKDGQEFLPGIQAVAAPGHTLGHTAFIITSDGKSLAFLGDTSHHPVLLFENPRVEFFFDTDAKLAAKSRARMLDMLASSRMPFIGYHFPWPGIGHAAKAGEGFHYFPIQQHMVL